MEAADIRKSKWYTLLLVLHGYRQVTTIRSLVELKTEVLTPILERLLQDWVFEQMVRGAWQTYSVESLMQETRTRGERFAVNYWNKVEQHDQHAVFDELLTKLAAG